MLLRCCTSPNVARHLNRRYSVECKAQPQPSFSSSGPSKPRKYVQDPVKKSRYMASYYQQNKEKLSQKRKMYLNNLDEEKLKERTKRKKERGTLYVQKNAQQLKVWIGEGKRERRRWRVEEKEEGEEFACKRMPRIEGMTWWRRRRRKKERGSYDFWKEFVYTRFPVSCPLTLSFRKNWKKNFRYVSPKIGTK